jgi:hypothetical protein
MQQEAIEVGGCKKASHLSYHELITLTAQEAMGQYNIEKDIAQYIKREVSHPPSYEY